MKTINLAFIKPAPYGFRKVGYQLVPCPKEIKVCRMIVKFIKNKGLSFSATARKLEEKKIKNRKGHISWSAKTVKAIYERWGEKLA